MKIKLRTEYAGPKANYAAGQVVEFPDADALLLIASGFAERVISQAELNAAKKAQEEEAARKKDEATKQVNVSRKDADQEATVLVAGLKASKGNLGHWHVSQGGKVLHKGNLTQAQAEEWVKTGKIPQGVTAA